MIVSFPATCGSCNWLTTCRLMQAGFVAWGFSVRSTLDQADDLECDAQVVFLDVSAPARAPPSGLIFTAKMLRIV
jgi:hypothetical protein